MPTNPTLPRGALTLALLFTLAACGGGGSDARPGDDAIPVASIDEFTAFVGARKADESSEPLSLEALMPPTSETAEPIEIG